MQWELSGKSEERQTKGEKRIDRKQKQRVEMYLRKEIIWQIYPALLQRVARIRAVARENGFKPPAVLLVLTAGMRRASPALSTFHRNSASETRAGVPLQKVSTWHELLKHFGKQCDRAASELTEAEIAELTKRCHERFW
ncbi:hypothetical protein FAX15_20200 [Escherichia coli]|nr:hypothetical protein FAX15_20200 [Escherichia coli]